MTAAALIAPVPRAPFTVRTPSRDCYGGVESENRAVVLALRLIYRGARHIQVADADGWVVGIYERVQ